MQQLSNEDNLRLNVLLAQPLQAIRINEGSMTVHALTEKGEAKVQLNPTIGDEQYLRLVRELFSMKVTGRPGGYPVFLKSWTRMGHTDNTVKHMLLLGESEAIIALVYGPPLSHEMGRRVWWTHPTTEVARRLLTSPEIVEGELGKELVEFLLEFLPFEEVQLDVVDTVYLCLQGDLISEEKRTELWKRAGRKNPYYVGFLHGTRNIPIDTEHSKHYEKVKTQLADLIDTDNIYAQEFCNILSAEGQRWLYTLKMALKKPVDPDVVISLFIAIDKYFNIPFDESRGIREIADADTRAALLCSNSDSCPEDIKHVIQALDKQHLKALHAFLMLAQLGEDTLIPIFAGNDSVGNVMRKRLLPVTTPILERVADLMS